MRGFVPFSQEAAQWSNTRMYSRAAEVGLTRKNAVRGWTPVPTSGQRNILTRDSFAGMQRTIDAVDRATLSQYTGSIDDRFCAVRGGVELVAAQWPASRFPSKFDDG